MPARQCYHCKQWIPPGEPHDCWTTTEAALTADLSDDLREAWERLRETAGSFGEQRIYASHKSIMFSRRPQGDLTKRISCYFFVRPKRSFLELCIFLGRALKAPQVRRVDRSSKSKFYHLLQIRHRDEVEPPLTDWLREAYAFSNAPSPKATSKPAKSKHNKPNPKRKKPNPARKPRTAMSSRTKWK
jgi:hypothetical protein